MNKVKNKLIKSRNLWLMNLMIKRMLMLQKKGKKLKKTIKMNQQIKKLDLRQKSQKPKTRQGLKE